MKGRDLSIPEFLDILQKEYFLAILRRKIYPSIKRKEYYKRLIGYKEEKILDISTKYSLPCIFNDEELLKKYKEEVFSTIPPDFIYKDDQEKEDLELSDEINYYLKGSSIKILSENESGIVKHYNLLDRSVKVKLNKGGIKWFDRTNINRIL
jgi:uncharacterized radical SAM superfamily protein